MISQVCRVVEDRSLLLNWLVISTPHPSVPTFCARFATDRPWILSLPKLDIAEYDAPRTPGHGKGRKQVPGTRHLSFHDAEELTGMKHQRVSDLTETVAFS
jgi:hypothetical protein